MPARALALALVLVALTPASAGCESCDFNFGPVLVTVTVTPRPSDRDVMVTVCPEDEICRTEVLGNDDAADTATDTGVDSQESDTGSDPPIFMVGWHGYAACKFPKMTITVSAPGCATVEQVIERQRPPRSADDRILSDLEVPVTLECL